MATIKDFARMCNSQISCEECSKGKINDMIECNQYICSHPECAEAIIDKWCAEHPVKTYRDDFFERFPKARKIANDLPCDCVNSFYGTDFHCDKDCKFCWNQVYKEEEQ